MLKNLTFISLILFAAGSFSCEKSTDSKLGVPQTGLGGSWIASEYIFDIGGGAEWKKVSSDQKEVISFDEAGKGTIYTNREARSIYYQTTSDSTLNQITDSGTAQVTYRLSGDTLEIAGYCYEACITRYLRAKTD